MTSDTIYIYTDASFSKFQNVAVIGFAIFESAEEHETHSITEDKIQLLQVPESNNIRAELRGAITALQSCPIEAAKKILLFSDCQTVIDLPSRREKLEGSNFISQSKNRPLSNADIYKEFYLIYDQLQPELQWIKGHSPRDPSNKVQHNFSCLDKAIRKKLRSLVL